MAEIVLGLARRLAQAAPGVVMIVGDDQHDLLDYIPAYRSPAGTGVGMAFATWNRGRAARTEQETAA